MIECLRANLTKCHSSVPGFGMPSYWSIFDSFCQHSTSTGADKMCDMALQSLIPFWFCHAVFIVYLGSCVLQNILTVSKVLAFEGQGLKYSVNMLTTENFRLPDMLRVPVGGTTFCQVCLQAFFCFLSPQFYLFFRTVFCKLFFVLHSHLQRAWRRLNTKSQKTVTQY